MAYGEQTAMNELIAGMAAVDPEACHEFARRQHRAGHAEELAAAAALIHEQAFHAQLDRPDELVDWKYPEHFEPLDTDWLITLLKTASDNDRATTRELIADHPFATITALSSLSSYLRQSIEHIRRYGTPPANPQQSLF